MFSIECFYKIVIRTMASTGQQQSKVFLTAASLIMTGLALYICMKTTVPNVAPGSSEREHEEQELHLSVEPELEHVQARQILEVPVPIMDSITNGPLITDADAAELPVETVVQIVETTEPVESDVSTHTIHVATEQKQQLDTTSELSAPIILPNVAVMIDSTVTSSDGTVVDRSHRSHVLVMPEVASRPPTKPELISSNGQVPNTTVNSTSEGGTTNPIMTKHKSRRSFMNKLRIRRKTTTKTATKSQDTVATNKPVAQ